MRNQLLLTFDVEDFINPNSIKALDKILGLLEKYNLTAIFFLTGHVAEKLAMFPKICQSLEKHEIGFHSSGHSVHPTIFEYCDIENYEDAVQLSLKRETAHLNPLSGDVEGSGGLTALRDLFPAKKILAYRAPGYCCPPPHLEAMASLGMKYDFSWNFSLTPVHHKGVTFYPRPIYLDCERAFLSAERKTRQWLKLLNRTILTGLSILNFHPHVFMGKEHWDYIYFKGNPSKLQSAPPRDSEQTKSMFANLENTLSRISNLERLGILKTNPELSPSKNSLDATKIDLDKAAEMFALWPRNCFSYQPKHILSQLSTFFNRYSEIV